MCDEVKEIVTFKVIQSLIQMMGGRNEYGRSFDFKFSDR